MIQTRKIASRFLELVRQAVGALAPRIENSERMAHNDEEPRTVHSHLNLPGRQNALRNPNKINPAD
jgi:hypothetical protein